MMATAFQQDTNNLKMLSNGNGLVHQSLNGYNTSAQTQSTSSEAGIIPSSCHQRDTTEQKQIAAATTTSEVGVSSQQEQDDEQVEVSAAEEAAVVEEPEIDIMINNVVCSFSVRCHLNLREIALNGINVEYRKENGKITMKLRRPYTTASIWSSGKVTCTGATSEHQAKIAARRFARCLQKLGFKVRFRNYRVVNVLGTCSMPFAIRINSFSERHREADYEPELHPGVTYKLQNPKATLKIFSTGSVTVTAPSVADVQAAIEHIFPLVYEFRKERSPEEQAQLALKKARQLGLHNNGGAPTINNPSDKSFPAAFDDEEEEEEEEGNEELFPEEDSSGDENGAWG